MELIKLPQMRLAQLQSFTDSTLSITTPLPEVSTQVQRIQAAYTEFLKGMTKTNAASDKKTLDKTRDLVNAGFFKNVEAEQLFPYSDMPTLSALAKVVNITNKYGFGLNRLPFDEQTAETDNMLNELNGLDLSTLPTLSRWIAPMTEANNQFRAFTLTYLEDVTTTNSTQAAYLVAKPLEDALNELFTVLFASVVVAKTEPLQQAYAQLITLCDNYKK